MTINPTAHINKGHIYFTDNVIKVKCISNTDKDNKQHNVTIGDNYTANTTTSHIFNNQHYETKSEGKYYFINERQTVMPAELFIPIDELREQQLNTILPNE
jgi:hypothetical protein